MLASGADSGPVFLVTYITQQQTRMIDRCDRSHVFARAPLAGNELAAETKYTAQY